jgi:hypothetical protein
MRRGGRAQPKRNAPICVYFRRSHRWRRPLRCGDRGERQGGGCGTCEVTKVAQREVDLYQPPTHLSMRLAPDRRTCIIRFVASKPAESKHARIRQALTDQIASGRYDAGQRLPSEAELVKAFGVSRPTVNRVLRELQLAGLIDRRAGSGSYVREDATAHGYVFGLLIPELGRT